MMTFMIPFAHKFTHFKQCNKGEGVEEHLVSDCQKHKKNFSLKWRITEVLWLHSNISPNTAQ